MSDEHADRYETLPSLDLPLADQVAIVTGASQGIGKAIALRLARQGATVGLVGRRGDALDSVANATPLRHSIHSFTADLGAEKEIRDLTSAIQHRWSRVDLLIHCAGIYARGPVREAPMNLASEIFTWQEGTRLYSRMTTNVSRRRLLARLVALNLLEAAETIHAFFGDRVNGGNGYEVLWKVHVRWDDLNNLVRL